MSDGTVGEFRALAAAQAGVRFDQDQEAALGLAYLSTVADGLDEVFSLSETESEKNTLQAYIRGTRWVVDVRLTSLVAASAAIDAIKTAGALNALLALSGLHLKAIFRLSTQDGQFCNYLTIVGSEGYVPIAKSAEEVAATTTNALCRHPNVDCQFRKDAVCQIKVTNVQQNFEALSERRILTVEVGLGAIRRI